MSRDAINTASRRERKRFPDFQVLEVGIAFICFQALCLVKSNYWSQSLQLQAIGWKPTVRRLPQPLLQHTQAPYCRFSTVGSIVAVNDSPAAVPGQAYTKRFRPLWPDQGADQSRMREFCRGPHRYRYPQINPSRISALVPSRNRQRHVLQSIIASSDELFGDSRISLREFPQIKTPSI